MNRAILKRSISAFACLALGCLLCVAILARPHVAEQWALYLGSPLKPSSATLFLDPFPDATSCDSRVQIFAANGERAFCAEHPVLEFGYAIDSALAADFNRLSPAAWFCSPRRPKLRTPK